MGMCLEKIMFMVMDTTPIEVVSATDIKDFDLKKIKDFQNKRGGFSVDVDNGDHYFFQYSRFNGKFDGKFVEFNIVR